MTCVTFGEVQSCGAGSLTDGERPTPGRHCDLLKFSQKDHLEQNLELGILRPGRPLSTEPDGSFQKRGIRVLSPYPNSATTLHKTLAPLWASVRVHSKGKGIPVLTLETPTQACSLST